MPSIGFLYPEGVESLCASEDTEALGKALDKYWVYRRIFQTAIVNEGMSVDDAFYLNEIRLLEGGFDSQFQLSEYFSGIFMLSLFLQLLSFEASGDPQFGMDQ